jgi:D-alanine-D-alanine ligase
MTERKLNILVLAGGESTERQVSLNSARAVTETLLASGHQVRVIDTLNGDYLTDESGKFLPVDPTGTDSSSAVDNIPQRMSLSSTRELVKVRQNGVDVVFIALHGGAGENGGIQALLDIIGVPYTGSPMAASATAMNKDIAKRVMQSLSIPTARWKRYDSAAGQSFDDVVADIRRSKIRLPFIIKPTDGGSTVGLSLVEADEAIEEAVRAAFQVSDSIMVEDYLAGREITISVLDGRALPPVEIKPTHKLYDYTCKYTKGKSQYICPAEIDEAITKKLSDDAVRFYRTIGCRGYARVDFIVASLSKYICLELNTLPGMTELSLFPMAARAAGIEFGELLDRLCNLALEGR